MFRNGLRWIVGANISFWHDNWIYPFALKDVVYIPIGNDDLLVEAVLNADKQCDVSLLQCLVPNHVMLDISSILIPLSSIENKQVWGFFVDGIYSVKLGAKLAQGFGNKSPNKVIFMDLGSSHSSPK